MSELNEIEILKARLGIALARVSELQKTNQKYQKIIFDLRENKIPLDPKTEKAEQLAGKYINQKLLQENTELKMKIEKLEKENKKLKNKDEEHA